MRKLDAAYLKRHIVFLVILCVMTVLYIVAMYTNKLWYDGDLIPCTFTKLILT